MLDQDTIVALATPPGPSALALIRVSGSRALEMVNRHISKPLSDSKTCYRVFQKECKERIDDVVLTVWPNPNSYTGEDLIEISCHGNMLIVDTIIKELTLTGAPDVRLARPGEFTERAFLNGKMDLTQAEAVMDLIHARSERALRAAQQLQSGTLGQRVSELQEQLLNLLAHLEAYIDFPEEDIDPQVGKTFAEGMAQLLESNLQLLSYAAEGRRLREGIKVVLVGAPNAGKSSLLNALVNRDRAIVSDIPGTTRDTIEEALLLHGIYTRFIDTAGIREKEEADHIEKMGISRTLKAIEQADLVVSLIDSSDANALQPVEIQNWEGEVPVITCLTKTDLPQQNEHTGISLSTQKPETIEELKNVIAQKLSLAEQRSDADLVAINNRHELLLVAAKESLERALQAHQDEVPPELISSDLRMALDAWGEIVGKRTNEDMLDRLFASFCIGK